MKKTLKLGWLMVLEGVLTREQLDNIISVQKTYPTRSIAEIASKLYKIPEGQTEGLFIKEILIPSLQTKIYEELGKNLKKNDDEVKKIVKEVEISVKKYQRLTIASKTFTCKTDNVYEPSVDKNFQSIIKSCVNRICLKTKYKTNLEFKDIDIEYDLENQKITFDSLSLFLEAKIKLNQLMKKNIKDKKNDK